MCVAILLRCVQQIRGGDHVDAFMCGLQSALTKATALRFCPLSVRVGMAGARAVSGRGGHKGATVAKIIEFYIPSNFRKNGKWIPPHYRGKIIEFSLQTKKSA